MIVRAARDCQDPAWMWFLVLIPTIVFALQFSRENSHARHQQSSHVPRGTFVPKGGFVMIETTHERTPEASARCKIGRGSCHDCAMTCPHGNQVRDEKGQLFPCGSDVFDKYGNILLCGECRQGWGEQ